MLDIGAQERLVQVILYDRDLFWSVCNHRRHIRWNSQARGVINIRTGTISAPTFAQCLWVGAKRLPPGRVPQRICGAFDEPITPETDSRPASVCPSDDEDVVGWLDRTRDYTILRILVILFREPYDGLRPEEKNDYEGSDTPPLSGNSPYITQDALLEIIARFTAELAEEDSSGKDN